MNCPRCYGYYFYNDHTIPYGLICGTCGLAGQYQLQQIVKFIPHVPLKPDPWQAHYNDDFSDFVFSPFRSYSGAAWPSGAAWCHAWSHVDYSWENRWGAMSPLIISPVHRPVPQWWGGSGWKDDGDPFGWGTWNEEVKYESKMVEPIKTFAEFEQLYMNQWQTPGPFSKFSWNGGSPQSYGECTEHKAYGFTGKEVKDGIEGIPKAKEDTREDNTTEGPKGWPDRDAAAEAARRFWMRDSKGSKGNAEQAPKGSGQGTPEVQPLDWCI